MHQEYSKGEGREGREAWESRDGWESEGRVRVIGSLRVLGKVGKAWKGVKVGKAWKGGGGGQYLVLVRILIAQQDLLRVLIHSRLL